jgi:DNA replication initiation complex subunit (GINS family)
MARKLSKVGRIKMALISRALINSDLGRIDLFLVGDDIHERKLHKFLLELEAEVGKEIQYASMDSKEFEYRYQMFDRFVRDIFEKPHEKLINKLGFVE